MSEANLLASVPDPFLDPAVGTALKTLTPHQPRFAAKAGINKIGFRAALDQFDQGSPTAPISYFALDLAPRSSAAPNL